MRNVVWCGMVRLVGRQVKGIIINSNDKKKCIVASERRKAQVRQKIACARERERKREGSKNTHTSTDGKKTAAIRLHAT